MNILITGGASGLGEAITRLLAKDNQNKIFFTYSKSIEAAKKIEFDFINTKSIKCDFKIDSEVDFLITKIIDFDIDVLINNAYTGEAIKNHFNKVNTIDFISDFTFNIIPTVKITQVIINNFRKKKAGKIITVLSSFLLNTPPIGSSIYVANKSYLASLVKSWGVENSKYNITSNSISPSFMKTNFTNNVDERIIEQMILNHPYKKLLTVNEVAETINFLINASPQINGIDIIMNAGVN
jgi:3-oxoacyl-[acyl-carrier protein] reductase